MLPPSKQFAVVHTATNAPESAIIKGPAADLLVRVAHEMRQPLAAATSALQLLQECPDNRARERARVVLERQFQRLSRFVDDLLEASLLRSGTRLSDLRLQPNVNASKRAFRPRQCG
jgi:signal transduction histidine kinase